MNIQDNSQQFDKIISAWLFPGLGDGKRRTRFLFAGLFVGLLMRLGMQWFVDYRFDVGDASYYLDAASNIVNHGVYSGDVNASPVPQMLRPPLYPFLVAAVNCFLGEDIFFIQLVQVIVSILTALLITRVAGVLAPKSSIWVFSLMMLSPFEAVYTGAVLSESITAFLLTATAYVLVSLRGMRRWGIGGVLLGLCTLTRDIYLPLIFLLGFGWAIFGNGRRQSRYCDLFVLMLSASLIVLPWSFRNYKISGRLVPVSEGRLGLSLWMGTWAVNGAFTEKDVGGQHVYPSEAFRTDSERQVVEHAFSLGGKETDMALRAVAIQRILTDPVAVFKVYIVRSPMLWLGTRFDIFELNKSYFPRSSTLYVALKVILWGVNTVIIVLGLGGLALAWWRRRRILMLCLPIVYTAAVYFPLNGFENRYSQPAYPFLIACAGYFLAWLSTRRSLSRGASDVS